jgi:nitric oxide reductase NorQ protein
MKSKKIILATVTQEGRYLKAITNEGLDVSSQIERPLRKRALEEGLPVEFDPIQNLWFINDGAHIATAAVAEEQPELVEPGSEHAEVTAFIHNSPGLKPKELFMTDLKWKYLVRSAMRGRNIVMVGAAGAGKTVAAKYLVQALQRPDFYFNLGATQDPRSTLIGNTHFNKDTGTYFSESLFVKAIQTENAIILLDELSRAHPEAWNILMTVLDVNQRYLRIDEKDGSPTIKVASGVCFVATANIGNEYTSTRVLDRALMDRFITIEMEQLNDTEEYKLLQLKFPKANKTALQAIAEIAGSTRKEAKSANPKLTSTVSTRASVECASLIYDGFTLAEAAEVAIYPFFSDEGGVDSERTYIKQIVQKFCSNPATEKKNLFDAADINKKSSTPF